MTTPTETELELGRDGEGEEFLGGLLGNLAKAVGLGETEYEDREWEDREDREWEDREWEGEGEAFLPALLPIAKLALPLLGNLFGGGKRESEMEGFEEAAPTAIPRPAPLAEVLAAAAANTRDSREAEAFIGAATVLALTNRERDRLLHLLPQLISAARILTRALRRSKRTRPAVRTVPTIITSTARQASRRMSQSNRPLAPAYAGRIVQRQTARVLGSPSVARRVVARNARTVSRTAATARRPVRQTVLR
jgi:hypothetical protein